MPDRYTLQMLATKLDTRSISLADAKRFVKSNFHIDVKGATRDQFLRNLSRVIAAGA